ncbi:MAG: 3-phosphoshikimate 1-carboxyvinyltransferase [Arcanobacterium sp.]|nr:3-phosphoshikimate 1-carboxyvinyltransferase [Arcanobacterium sp.]
MQNISNWQIPSCFDSATESLQPIKAKVRIPGSKSLTNRYLILAALSEKPTIITDALIARDTQLMIAALQSLGCEINITETTLTVSPGKLIGAQIDAGLAGTVMRFIPPIAALASGTTIIDGDAHARKRPMEEIISALTQLGVSIRKLGSGEESLPIEIIGTDFAKSSSSTLQSPFSAAETKSSANNADPNSAADNANTKSAANNADFASLTEKTLSLSPKTMPVVKIDASRSSQFISALLLSAARYPGGMELQHQGKKLPSLPHIEMTLEVLREAGVKAEHTSTTPHTWRVFPGVIQQPEIAVEPDLTNAGPFLAAAMLTSGTVTIQNWPIQKSVQPGLQYREIFTQMGGTTNLCDSELTLIGPKTITALNLDCAEIGELVPTLAAVAAFAKGTSRFTNIEHLRGHETDRLAAIAKELQKIGIDAYDEPDALVIKGVGGNFPSEAKLRNQVKAKKITMSAYADHRMATFAALIGLRIPELELDDIAATTKTFPTFVELWQEVAS